MSSTGSGDDADPQARTIIAGLTSDVQATPSHAHVVHPTSVEDAPQLLGNRYELLGMLGAGAMGTVYRARDRELDDVVALKVLKKELASPQMIERFRREVKLARRVTHKNVARTFDIGEHAPSGDRFLTMEFVEGEMLGSLVARKGRLPIADVSRFALDICAGLSAAHAANVLHRDLKPENVIISKDEQRGAVITDFGIARVAAEGELSQTMGGIVGTPAYMAPEQVEGATDLDARADLYALGTMLFELLTGEMAWKGDSIVTVAAGRLLRPPPDVRSVVPSLPASVAEVVIRLMARQREDRYSSAEEVAQVLITLPMTGRTSSSSGFSAPPPPARPSSGTLPITHPSSARMMAAAASPVTGSRRSPHDNSRVVAVLPVLNLGASDDAYLVDNVTEDIVDHLSMVPGLLVRPRGETARFTDGSRDPREIGRSLGVNVVVDGSLRRNGDTVRASFRLIAVEDGFQLWAKRFDRPPAQLLSIADDAAQAIAKALTAEVDPSSAQALNAGGAMGTKDPIAEDLFLRGRHLLRRGWAGSAREAVDLLTRAHERASDDPRIMATYAVSLARVYGWEYFEREAADRARDLAARALTINPLQSEALVAIAMVHLVNGEAETAVGYLREALEITPNAVDALDWLGRLAAEVGRVDEGIALLERVIAIEPDSVSPRFQIARIKGMIGDRAAANKLFGAVPPTDPSDLAGWLQHQSRQSIWYRDTARAAELQAILAANSERVGSEARFQIQGALEVAMGHAEKLAETTLLDRVLPIDGSRPPRRAYFNAQLRAELFASVHDDERAMQMIMVADAHGLLDLMWLDRCVLLEPLRSRADFLPILDRVKHRSSRVSASFDARLPSRKRI